MKELKITFFTNFINHHQVPIAEEFYNALGDNYILVATEPIPQSFLNSGYSDYSNKQYLLKAYDSNSNYQKALQLGLDSDIVIIGSAPPIFIKERLKENKITFRYSERLFKKIDYHLLSPRAWLYWYNSHFKYRSQSLYMLCASAYMANDLNLLFSYPNKKFKWGYFTEVKKLDINQIILEKPVNHTEMIWVGRFIDWKHPELVIKLAFELKSRGYNFHLKMIGSGNELTNIQQLILILKLGDVVTLVGNLPNEEVGILMKRSNIFLFTSDRNEGWGAVLNEAMSSGCAVVASHEIGAVPYLIDHGNNGLVFKSKSLSSLLNQTEILFKDASLRNRLGINAYTTMVNDWSPKNAVLSFLKLVILLKENKTIDIVKGPCSLAKNIDNDFWIIKK